MQKKLTVLFAFAIFVLVVGWAITPAQADPPRPNHNHGGGGNGNDETFFVDLDLGMLTTGLPVTVKQDTSKRIRFGNSNFDHPAGIEMQFRNLEGEPITGANCVGVSAVNGGDLDDFAAELTEPVIKSGFFIVKVDGRDDPPGTGILVLEYTGDLGDTRIQYDGRIVSPPPVVMEDDPVEGSITFHFFGTIFVWQLNESGNADDKIVACERQAVNVILHQ